MDTKTLVIGALLIGGGFYLYSKHQAAAAVAPSLEDQANKALVSENNPIALRALAAKVRAAGFDSLADTLEAKATGIEAFKKGSMNAFGPQTTEGKTIEVHPAATIPMLAAGSPATIATRSLAQAILAGASVHAPRYIEPPPADPNLSPQNL